MTYFCYNTSIFTNKDVFFHSYFMKRLANRKTPYGRDVATDDVE